ncbi:DNA replication/repair protein RecF [Chlamydia pecorum]|uniref:DNA replication and repair protein RecF n=3 Tax=Chlamydia pecorum TaxID=85991 RepID=A0AA34WI38_CHLPE|nr:DNA replication/repair protein RecF [Chlamydia pecorum]AEB41738.1 DNA replication and repair protein recF [Chlamydia pecorum E58]AGW38846.1 recombination protein F [Chlamydia pecorum W73]AGW39771.1 recombination protein F [Chlamydia pecorum P787]ETF37499.1 DNA replication and repair protein RecF [Chlamydia pecorum VR629]ETF38007.1 DNA replication and repair protein RecF [Chlamydia pecorum DBDeUG]
MKIVSLTLKNFRSYKDTEVSFAPRVNYISGSNAQGKTNLLEALYILSLGRSFRTQHLSEAIAFGASYFFLKIAFEKFSCSHTLSIYVDKYGKKLLFDNAPVKTLSEMIGKVPMVLFSSKDRLLISGAPADRRLFLNLLLSQCDPYYTHTLSYYQQALLQRNALLKTKNTATISVWNEQLAKLGGYITFQRYTCCDKLNVLMQSLWSNPLKEHLLLKFKSSLIKTPAPKEEELSQELLKQLLHSLPRDLELKSTSVGPHREDFTLMMNQEPASTFASEGQKHSFLTILRLAESLYLQHHHNLSPLVCIDDLHASLDSQRASQLLQLAPNFGQTLITSTQPLYTLPENSKSLHIKNSCIY